MRRFITDAVEEGKEPKRTVNESIILRQGREHKVLVSTAGNLTKAGLFYEELTGSELITFSFDTAQTPSRVGNVETIKLRGGKERTIRIFDPAADEGRGEYRYTALGKKFFSKKRLEYIIRVPARFSGTRSNGRAYNRDGFYPVHEPISAPLTYTTAQRDAHIKLHVTNSFPDGVIAEYSEEIVKYRPDGQWSIVELITTPENMAHPDVMERPLGTHPGSVSTLPFPESIVASAFEDQDDKRCCIRQISDITKMSVEEVSDQMDECELTLYGTDVWRHQGCTSKLIFEFARRTGRGACLVHGGKSIEVLTGPDALVYCVHGSHAFFYSDKRVRKQLMNRKSTDFQKIKRDGRESTTPDASEWKLFSWPPQPGHFYVEEDQIDFVRELFLKDKKHPKVVLKDESRIKSLRYVFTKIDDEKGTCVVHARPPDAVDMIQWLQNLDIGMSYKGEGLANLTYKVLNKLIKKRERRRLEGEERHELLESVYSYSCASCGAKGRMEWDHTVRLSQSYGEQRADCFAPRCPECHANKTAEEPQEFDSNPLESNVDRHVWQEYVMSARPPPLIYKNEVCDNVEQCRIADVRRCRMRALLLNVHPIPVLSPLDNIQKCVDYQLGDLNFITKKATDFIVQLGYTCGWQHRIQTEWLLYTGVICWDDIAFKIVATGRLPADLLKEPLMRMEESWGDAGLGKQSINSMIGAWMLDECYSYSLISSNYADDAPPRALKRVVHYEGGSVTDYITKTQLLSVTTLRPLHDLCMCTEAVRVGQMLYCLKKQKAVIYEIKTDSCLYKPGKKAKGILEELTFKELRLRDKFEKSGMKRLNEHCTLSIPDCDLRVYRVTDAQQSDLMKMDPQMPRRDATFTWAPRRWRELSEEQATKAVLNGANLFVQGIAGTGKTFFVKELVLQLRALGKQIDIIAKTHTASARAGGCTADHYVRRSILHGCCTADVIWVEEVSQIECSLWAQCNKVNKQWILSGDFNQFPPVYDSYRGCEVMEGSLESSAMFHRMAGGNRLTLTSCRRADQFLFDFYSSLIKGGERFHLPLADVIDEARRLFHFEGISRNNLCISHVQRRRLNKEVNLALKPEGALLLHAKAEKGQLNMAQNMYIWEGIQLLGCTSAVKRGIRNNVLYTVTKVDEEYVWVKGECSNEELKLSFFQVTALLRLSFARTYASCQGTEFAEELRLHDVSNRHFTMRHLFVAVSRCKDKNKIDIA